MRKEIDVSPRFNAEDPSFFELIEFGTQKIPVCSIVTGLFLDDPSVASP
ncbi:MAG: hypothetical protein CM1200mP14_25150 [Gammaproteobacteria bacterium]|nr:MAG: hypothetical protein CM1200mP14_25150 [Gammaproteobacteria bacterium]